MEENKQKKDENCPLCRVSEETLEKLKNNQPKKSFDEVRSKETKKIKKSLWKLW